MSALGQKRTCAVQLVKSALHPKADMCGATSDVRFVPIADIALSQGSTYSFDVFDGYQAFHSAVVREHRANITDTAALSQGVGD